MVKSVEPPLIVTLGDPNGLGPELVCRLLLEQPEILAETPCLVIGPEAALTESLRVLDSNLSLFRLDTLGRANALGPGVYLYEPPGFKGFTPRPGQAHPEGGMAAGLSLDAALGVLGMGEAKALVTCPLNKAMLQEAGFDFPGHTEFLAQRSGVGPKGVCMHLAGPRLRVSLATTHPPLREVAGMLEEERILRCLELTCGFVDRLGQVEPVAVCGLNPHAGEWGRIGDEEARIIEPAVSRARDRGFLVQGPFPADTLFHRAAAGEFSAVLAMYHDQGLAPLKLLHFTEAVNVTLGLPFVRTSPDHGTGYDLVGTGKASVRGLANAVKMALSLCGRP